MDSPLSASHLKYPITLKTNILLIHARPDDCFADLPFSELKLNIFRNSPETTSRNASISQTSTNTTRIPFISNN